MKITTRNDESLHFRIHGEPAIIQTHHPDFGDGWQTSVPIEITEGGKREIKLKRIATFDLNGTPKTFVSELKSEKESGLFEKGETLTMASAIFGLKDSSNKSCDLLSVRIETVA